MAKYLISFPSAAMVVTDGEWEAAGRDSHAVIDEAKAAGVYVFGGHIDEDVPPFSSQATAGSPRAVIRGRRRSTAASPCLNCPRVKRPSRGPRASQRPADAPRNCASSISTRSPDGVGGEGAREPLRARQPCRVSGRRAAGLARRR